MGNTDIFEMVANRYDTDERIKIVKATSDAIRGIGYREIQSKTFYTGSKMFMGNDASLFILDSQ